MQSQRASKPIVPHANPFDRSRSRHRDDRNIPPRKSAHALDLYWDANGAAAGTGGTGTWTAANTWRLGSDAGALQSWADGNNAHFLGSTAGIVTISGGTTVSPVTSFFELTGYTLRPSNTSLTTLAGSISLSAGVNLNFLSAADTADRQLAIGSVTGGVGSSLTFLGGQTAAGSNARIFLNQANSSIDVPITISGTGSTFAGFVASATGTSITGTIANSSGFTTLLGATSGSDLTLSSTAVISGSAGVRIGVANATANAGTVTLNAASTYTGGTSLRSTGTLAIGNDSALGTGTFTIETNAGGTILASGGARNISNNTILAIDAIIGGSNDFTFSGSFTSSGSSSRMLTVNNSGTTTLAGNVFLSENNSTAGRVFTINGTGNTTISGVIANNNAGNTVAAGLAKGGTGTLTLTNANTYSGNTTVSGGGTLLVSNTTGSGTGTGNVTVNGSGTTLGGTGTISGTVTLGNATPGAILNPGPKGTAGTAASVGTLSTGALTLTGANTFHIDASGTLTSNWDKLVVNGAVVLGTTSTLDITIANSLSFTAGSMYTLIDKTTAGAISGTFSGIVEGGTYTFSGYDFTASYIGGDGNNFVLTAVPEPSTWVAAALALAAVGWSQRKRFARRRAAVREEVELHVLSFSRQQSSSTNRQPKWNCHGCPVPT
jgi:autotransporter-associated beta strand protein